MIIIYSLVLLSFNFCFALEKAGQLPAAKRIPLTPSERSVFLSAKKIIRSKKTETQKPENVSQLLAQSNTFKNSTQADELLNLQRKIQEVHWWTTQNLFELKRLEPHLQILTQKHSSLTSEWQHESNGLCCKLLEYSSDLKELSNQLDITLSQIDSTMPHEEYVEQLRLFHREIYFRNVAIKQFRLSLVDKLSTNAHLLEPFVSTQKIKEKIRGMDQGARADFILRALHTLENHYETYTQINKAVRALQTLLKIPLISRCEESKRIHFITVLKRAQALLTPEFGVAIIVDVTHLPLYKKEVHACTAQQIQNIRKTHQYSIQFRMQDPILSSDGESKSEVLYFFSKGESLLNQHELVAQLKETNTFKFKSAATAKGFCVANKDLRVNRLTESLWHIGQDYYFKDNTNGTNFYKVDIVAALNLPQQKSPPSKIQP